MGQKISLPFIKKDNLIMNDENGNYKVHYGSFYNLAKAERCIKVLVGDKQKSFFVLAQQQNNKVYRVYLGSFKTYDEAQKACKKYRFKYVPF